MHLETHNTSYFTTFNSIWKLSRLLISKVLKSLQSGKFLLFETELLENFSLNQSAS